MFLKTITLLGSVLFLAGNVHAQQSYENRIIDTIAEGSPWIYRYTPSTPDSDWYDPSIEAPFHPFFNGTDNAEFGFGDGDESTIVPSGKLVHYIRKNFTLNNQSQVVRAKLYLRYDEGIRVVLNSNEIYRANLPTGATDSFTAATGGSDPLDNPEWIALDIDIDDLIEGRNCLALDAHQRSRTVEDLSVDAKLSIELKPDTFYALESRDPIPYSDGDITSTDDQWGYSDTFLSGSEWKTPGNNVLFPYSGEAPLGYNYAELATLITESNGDGIVCLRRSFSLSERELQNLRDLWLDLTVDDGATVYLNGVEIVRFNQEENKPNIPARADIDERTISYYFPSDEVTKWIHGVANYPPLNTGENILAVIVTQASDSDPDMIFNCRLRASYEPAPDHYLGHFQSATTEFGSLAIEDIDGSTDINDYKWVTLDANGLHEDDSEYESPELLRHSALDDLVRDLDGDPLALAAYVQNEIELTGFYTNNDYDEEFLHSETIHRGALGTYLEGQGNPYEQCALLVYLLRRSGHAAAYVEPQDGIMHFTADHLSRMLQLKLWGLTIGDSIEGGTQILDTIAYPWVTYYDEGEEKWHYLFPWIKDTAIDEGFDVYQFMPEGYRSGKQWVEAYLKNDPAINKHIWEDGDDTAGKLFYRFAEEHLAAHGLSLEDTGMHVSNRRHRYESWEDLPRPFAIKPVTGSPTDKVELTLLRDYRNNLERFAQVEITTQDRGSWIAPPLGGLPSPILMCEIYNRRFFAHYNFPNTIDYYLSPFDSKKDLSFDSSEVGNFRIKSKFRNAQRVTFPIPAVHQQDYLQLHVNYDSQSGTVFEDDRNLKRNALGAICIMNGRVTREMLDIHANDFWQLEQAPTTPDQAVIAGNVAYLLGMSYYERTMRNERKIANLHNVRVNKLSVGIAKMTPQTDGSNDWRYPSVDMPFKTHSPLYRNHLFTGDIYPEENDTRAKAVLDYYFVNAADVSSHEHQVINDFFNQHHAISTVKLLRTANETEKGNFGNSSSNKDPYRKVYDDGFYSFSDATFPPTDSDVDYEQLKASAGSMWDSIKTIRNNPKGYAYVTPTNIKSTESNTNPAYDGMGALIVQAGNTSASFAALIANQANGGAGTAFRSQTFSSNNFQNLQLNWQSSGYRLSSSSGSIGENSTNFTSGNINRWNAGATFSAIDSGSTWLSAPSTNFLDSASSFLGWSAPSEGNYGATWGNIVSSGLFDTNTSSFINAYQSNSFLGDPVSITTGELYVDEVDITLEGPLPLQVRRNYSSRNEAPGLFGYGWKMAFTPQISIPRQEDDPGTTGVDESEDPNYEVVYIAELDGSTLAYRLTNPSASFDNYLWKPTFEDNPNLSNYNGGSIGSTQNPYLNQLSVEIINSGTSDEHHKYTLKRANGSIAVYKTDPNGFSIGEDEEEISWNHPLIQIWTDAFGNQLSFEYYTDSTELGYGQLRRINSSNGNFLTFYYSTSGQIVRVISNDGRMIHYTYSDEGDLVSVQRADGSKMEYEYQYADIEKKHFTFEVAKLLGTTEISKVNLVLFGDSASMVISDMRYWPDGLNTGEPIDIKFDANSKDFVYIDKSYLTHNQFGTGIVIPQYIHADVLGESYIGADGKSIHLKSDPRFAVTYDLQNQIAPTPNGVIEFYAQIAGDLQNHNIKQTAISFNTSNTLRWHDDIPDNQGDWTGWYNKVHYNTIYSGNTTREGVLLTLHPDNNTAIHQVTGFNFSWLFSFHHWSAGFYFHDVIVDDRFFDYGPVDGKANSEPTSTHLLTKIKRPNGRTLVNEYDPLYNPFDTDTDDAGPDEDYSTSKYRRVVKQYSTVGPDLQLYPVNSFTYTAATDSNQVEYDVTYVDDLTRDPANPFRTTYVHKDGLMHHIADPLANDIISGGVIGNTDIDHVLSFEWCDIDEGEIATSLEYPRSVKSIRDKRGLVTTFEYDDYGNILTATDTGELDGVTGNESITTHYFYNSRNLLQKSISPAPSVSSGHKQVSFYEYPDNGSGGDIVELQRDISNVSGLTKLREYAYLPNSIYQYAVPYNTADDATKPSSGLISTTSFLYGYEEDGEISAHGLTKRVITESNIPNYSYDRSETISYYDERGYLTSQKNWVDGSNYLTTTFKHNDKGELYHTADPAGRATEYRYDMMGRPTIEARLAPSGDVAMGQYQYYNENGEVTWSDGPREDIEDYVFRDYDGDGRLIAEIVWRAEAKEDGSGLQPVSGQEDLLGQAITLYNYDNFGNLTSVIDPLGNETSFTYDEIGRLESTTYADDSTEYIIFYEPGGNPIQTQDTLGAVTTTSYNSLGLPTSVVSPLNQVTSTEYYLDGRPKKITYHNNSYENYTYDDSALSATVELRSSSNDILDKSITWMNARGNVARTRIYVGDGATNNVDYFETEHYYDGLGRPTLIIGPPFHFESGIPLSENQTTSTEYIYDSLTQTYKVRETSSGVTIDTTYDYLDRPILTETKSAGTIVSKVAQSYAADHGSVTTTRGSDSENDLEVTVYADTFGNPVLTKNKDGSYAISAYDVAGNLVASRDEYGTKAQKFMRFTYDNRNRIESEQRPDGSEYTFVYDSEGNMTRRTMPGDLVWTANYDSSSRIDWEQLQEGDSGPITNSTDYNYYDSGDYLGLLHTTVETVGASATTIHTHDYDDKFRLHKVTSDNSSIYQDVELTYDYDLMDRMVEVVRGPPSGLGFTASRVTMAYDGYGQLINEKVEIGSLSGGNFTSSETVSHLWQGWDSLGRRQQLIDVSSGSATTLQTFNYRADGKLSETEFGTAKLSYDYDDNGLPNSETLSQNGTDLFRVSLDAYDERGRILSRTTRYNGHKLLTENAGSGYTPDSKLKNYQVIRGAGNSVSWDNLTESRDYAYDKDSRRLLSESYRPKPTHQEHVTLHYQFDDDSLGVRTGVSFGGGSDLTTIGAGGLSGLARVTSESFSTPLTYNVQGSSTGPGHFTLLMSADGTNFDEVGQIDSQPSRGDGSWSFPLQIGMTDAAGDTFHLKARAESVWNDHAVESAAWPITVTNGSEDFSYSYDEQGRLLNKTTSGYSESFTWDALGNLTGWSNSNNIIVQFDYDGLGRCYRETVTDLSNVGAEVTTINTTYDPLIEFQVLKVSRTGGIFPAESVWLFNGNDLDSAFGLANGVGGRAAVIDADTGELTPLIDDWFGNVVAHVDTVETITAGDDQIHWRQSALTGYGPTGDHDTGGYATDHETFAAGLHWQGRMRKATGYFAMGMRHYDPRSGRFLSPDPLGHSATPDLYSYAGGDPINGIDFDGRINRETFDLQQGALFKSPELQNISWQELASWNDEPMSFLDGVQMGLDAVGMFPIVGNIADGINVGISLVRGNYKDAAMRAVFMTPGVGIAAAGGYAAFKYGSLAYKGTKGAFSNSFRSFSSSMKGSGQAFDKTFDRIMNPFQVPGLNFRLGVVAEGPSLATNNATRQRVLANIADSRNARISSNFPTVAGQNAQLLDITARASRITDRLIAQGSTHWARVYSNPALQGPRFATAFNRNPNLARALIRGNIMDDVSKQLSDKANLPFLRSTPRGARGPDFINSFLDTSWDVTTPGSWQRHVDKYGTEFGDLLPLLY